MMAAPRQSACAFSLFFLITSFASAQTFQPGPGFSAGDGPRGLAVADFNRDGWVDTVTADALSHSITITWTDPSFWDLGSDRLTVGRGPFDVTTGDFNADGYPDIAVANADGNSVSVAFFRTESRNFAGNFRSDGTQAVTPLIRTFATGANPRGITAADFDNDGQIDLAVSLYAAHAVEIYLNDGTGRFTRASVTDINGGGPQGIAAADIDRDGNMDLAIARNAGITVTLFGDGTGRMPGRSDLGSPVGGRRLVFGDFDRDGDLDLAVADYADSVTVWSGSVDCSESCRWHYLRVQTIRMPSGSNPRDIATADLDHDGRLDLVTANRGTSQVAVMSNTGGTPWFAAPAFVDVGSGAGTRSIALADFDHSGGIDAAVANENVDGGAFLFNSISFPETGFGFTLQTLRPREPGAFVGADLCAADINVDGMTDVLWPRGDGRVTFFSNVQNGDGSQTDLLLGGSATPRGCAIADFNGDGEPDVAVVNGQAGGGIYAFDPNDDLSDSSGQPTITPTMARPTNLATGDFNSDGLPDLVVTSDSGRVTVYTSLGYHGRSWIQFAAAGSQELGRYTSLLSVADLNRDGHPDVVTGDTESGMFILLGDGRGGLVAPRSEVSALTPVAVVVGDFTEDGIPDIFENDGGSSLRLLIGVGDGTFRAVAVGTTSICCDLAAGDLNHDGHLDVVGQGQLIYGHGDGTFDVPGLLLDRRRLMFRPLVADTNGDGLNDIASFVADPAGDTVSILRNKVWRDNAPPVANAGPDKTAPAGTFTPLDGRAAADPDVHALQFEWRNSTGVVVGREPVIFVSRGSPGSETFSLTVIDPFSARATDSVTVTFTASGTPREVVLYAGEATTTAGSWMVMADASAAGGKKMYQPNAGAPKVTTASANPANYFELAFNAEAGRPYHLWIRGRADANYYGNDSVHVQFSDSVTSGGVATYRIGTTSSTEWNLEECAGCGVSGWGWEDNGWGAVNQRGPDIYFATTGPHTIRLQAREDGVAIDQIVLSSGTYLTTRPGTAKNDTHILAR